MSNTPEEWFKSLPVITKTYFILAVGTTVLVSFGIISPYSLFLDWDKVIYKFHIWRLFTCFLFFGGFSLPFVFQIVLLVRYFGMSERDHFQGLRGRAEMLWMLIFGGVVMWAICYFFGYLYNCGPVLVFMVVYVWSRHDAMMPIELYGFSFKSWHLPFVFLLAAVVMGSSPVLDMFGILVGHIYHFLSKIVPRKYNREIIPCPNFLYEYITRQASGNPPPQAVFRRPGNSLQ